MLSYSCQTVDSMLSIFHRPIEKSTNGRIIVISSIWGETEQVWKLFIQQ